MWVTPWTAKMMTLYEGLKKHEATALFLLRTEILGLNAWLASVGVPGILPCCTCGAGAQTVRHILLSCPDHEESRIQLLIQTGAESVKGLLSTPRGAKATARWFIQRGLLRQFDIAREIEEEDTTHYSPPQDLDSWIEITRQ